MTPERLWWWSGRLYARGLRPLASVLKLVNFLVFHTVLPPECQPPRDVKLFHRGLGTVVHPNTRLGRRVAIGHGVTIAAGSQEPGSPLAVHVGDDVVIAAGCFVRPRRGRSLTIGAGARLAAHSVVIDDVPAGAIVTPPLATIRGSDVPTASSDAVDD